MVYPLMNQTLPTIVGMGVVSRATDTMFRRRGRGNRRRVTVKPIRRTVMPKHNRFQYPKYRVFDGRRFTFNGSADTKRGAIAIKRLHQDQGKLVRIVPHYDVYLIYVRGR